MDQPSQLAKQATVFQDSKAQTGFLGQRYDNVAMVHIGKPPDQVGSDFFGSASDARRTDPGLTREGNGQAHFALGATQKSDPIVQVTTAKQLFEDTLSFSVKRPVGRLIATFVDLEERFQVVDENSPQWAPERFAWLVPADGDRDLSNRRYKDLRLKDSTHD